MHIFDGTGHQASGTVPRTWEIAHPQLLVLIAFDNYLLILIAFRFLASDDLDTKEYRLILTVNVTLNENST